MAELYAITGVMAAGKSTVAELLAQRFDKGVHLRGDVFRRMIVSGREEMCAEPSAEAVQQLHLRYRLAVDAAKAYFEAGFSVVLQDNYYGQEWANLLERFSGYPVRAVVLCPDVEAVRQREAARGKKGYTGFAIEPLHAAFLRETPRLGFWLDSSRLSPQETVEAILTHFQERNGL